VAPFGRGMTAVAPRRHRGYAKGLSQREATGFDPLATHNRGV